MKALLFYPLWQLFIVGFLSLTGVAQMLTPEIEGMENPMFNRYPQTWEEFENTSAAAITETMPYITSGGVETSTATLSPWGFVKNGVHFYIQMVRFNVSTGDSYVDAILYLMVFVFPGAIVLLYVIMRYVRGL